jgi:hypothetical protein
MSNDEFLSMQNDVFGEFVPDLLLIKVSEPVINDRLQLGYSRTFIHEYAHWIQFAGTNWGFMQLLLGQGAINSIVNTTHYGDIQTYLEGFKKLSINERFHVNIPSEYNATSGIFYSNWQDSFITKKILSSSSNAALQIPNAYQSVAVALCDYTNSVNFLLNEPTQDINVLEKLFTFPDLIGFRLSATEDFTTFDLVEGQAKINEVLHEISLQLNSQGVFEIDFSKFIKGEYPAVYSKAFNFYCQITKKNFKFDETFELYHFIEACIEFAVIVDVSLAITVSPFLPSHAYHYITWDDVYPPIRFRDLCGAAYEVGFNFKNKLNKNLYSDFVAAICKLAGYANPVDQTRFFLETHKNTMEDLEKRWSYKVLKVENLLGITDFLLFLTFKFNQLRQEHPEVICLPGWSGVAAKLMELKWDKDYYWLHCPFEVQGCKFFNRIPKELEGLSGYLIGLLVTNKVLEQHIIRNIPLEQIRFPFEVDAKLKGIVCRHIKQILGIELKWL